MNTRLHLYDQLVAARKNGSKKLAVLIDPDSFRLQQFEHTLELAIRNKVDYFFMGGSLLLDQKMDACIQRIRTKCQIPIILFPGNTYQVHPDADAILFLSLVSGRNPDFLIGQHVVAAPYIRKSKLEVLPTAYMLIDGGSDSTVRYMSNTNPIPHAKTDIAVSTSMAAEMLGLKMIFMDAGSGAHVPVSTEMIAGVRASVQIPVIVGGGIRNAETVSEILQAGADLIVVGTAFEEDPSLLFDISSVIHAHNVTLKV